MEEEKRKEKRKMKRISATGTAAVLLVLLVFLVGCPTSQEPPKSIVLFDTNGSPVNSNFTVEAVTGECITGWSVVAPEGYAHDGWFYQGERWDFSTDKVMGDMTLVAHWIPLTYVVSFEDAERVFATQEVSYLGLVEPPMDPDEPEGMRFVCWTYEGREWDFATERVTGNMTLSAYYEATDE